MFLVFFIGKCGKVSFLIIWSSATIEPLSIVVLQAHQLWGTVVVEVVVEAQIEDLTLPHPGEGLADPHRENPDRRMEGEKGIILSTPTIDSQCHSCLV